MPVAAVVAAVAAVTAVAAVGSTVMQMSAQKKAAKENKKAARYERQKSELQAARERISAIKEGRQAFALAQQTAENQGVSDSSGASGGQGSIQSQTGANLSFLDQYGFASDMAYKHGQKAADYMADASMWGSIAGLSSSIYQATGGLKFTGPKPPAGTR